MMLWPQTVKSTGTIDDIKITASSDGMVHIAYQSSTDAFELAFHSTAIPILIKRLEAAAAAAALMRDDQTGS